MFDSPGPGEGAGGKVVPSICGDRGVQIGDGDVAPAGAGDEGSEAGK